MAPACSTRGKRQKLCDTPSDLVIAQESHEDGWWEAIVVAIENDRLVLRWRDYARQPCVRRGRLDVALLRIASPEMFPNVDPLPHLKCSRPGWGRGDSDEAGEHGDAG